MVPTKFNPIHAMRQLFQTMLKNEPSLVLQTPSNDKQIILALVSILTGETKLILTGETKFKKFFKVLTTCIEKQNQMHICIGCHMLSNCSLGNIKFQSTDSHLLAWLKKECVFVESDSLGTNRLVTIGYFTKVASTLTNLANFHEHLVNQLMLIDITANTDIKPAPHLKKAQLNAMMNGDDYIPILPNFEIYRMQLSYGKHCLKLLLTSLGSKVCQKMPNYSANSSHAWLLTPATTIKMEFSYQKTWPTYLDHKPMHKSCRRTTFPDYCGDDTS